MGEKFGIVKNANKAYQELLATFRHLFGKIEIHQYPLNLASDVKNIKMLEETSIRHLAIGMDKPLIKYLDERQILKKEAIPIHFSKLKFAIFSLPIGFSTDIKNIEIIKLYTQINFIKPISNVLSISRIAAIKDLISGVKKLELRSLQSKVYEGIEYLEKIPYKAKRKSLTEFNSGEIISFWELLLSKAQIPRADLELVGVFEPIPLHKIKKIEFNSQDGSLDLFIDAQKRYSNHPPARLIVGRDKKNGKIFTVVIAL